MDNKFKDLLSQIKKLAFSGDATEGEPDPNEQKFEAANLTDGTLIQIEPTITEGSAVTIEDPELGFVPVPDGSYELEDGRVIVVTGGVIESIQDVAEAPEEEELDTEAPAPTMTEQEIRKIIKSTETHFNSVIEDLKKEITDIKAESQTRSELFVSALEELGKAPAEVIPKPKNGLKFGEKKNNNMFTDRKTKKV